MNNNSGMKSYLAGTFLLKRSRHSSPIIKSFTEPAGPQAEWLDSNYEKMINVGIVKTKLGHWCTCCMAAIWSRDVWDEIISFINELYCISLTKSSALCMLEIIPSKSKMCARKKKYGADWPC